MLINKGMKLDIVPNAFIPSSVNTELQSFAIGVESFDYLRSCIDSNFCSHSCSHKDIEEELVFKSFENEEERAFLLRINSWVSCPKIL